MVVIITIIIIGIGIATTDTIIGIGIATTDIIIGVSIATTDTIIVATSFTIATHKTSLILILQVTIITYRINKNHLYSLAQGMHPFHLADYGWRVFVERRILHQEMEHGLDLKQLICDAL